MEGVQGVAKLCFTISLQAQSGDLKSQTYFSHVISHISTILYLITILQYLSQVIRLYSPVTSQAKRGRSYFFWHLQVREPHQASLSEDKFCNVFAASSD